MVPTALSVLSAVCVTALSDALGASPTTNLLAAALGALLVPVIGVAGSYWGLRLAAGLAITGGALLVTYGGFSVFDRATDRESVTFPQVDDPVPTPTGGGATPTSTVSSGTCEGELCITVSPAVVRCGQDGCDSQVTVVNSGTELLRLRDLEVEGEGARQFSIDHDGDCQQRALTAAAACTIEVLFRPAPLGGPVRARLVVHQNLAGPASFVALRGESPLVDPRTLPDLEAVEAGVTCRYEPGGMVDGRDALQISFGLLLHPGTREQHTGPTTVRASSSSLGTLDVTHASGSGDVSVVSLPVGAADLGGSHEVLLEVDPDGAVPERDESNNRLRVLATLPTPGSASTPVLCDP